MSCIICGGPLMALGSLGCLMWYRCRNCGLEQNKKIDGEMEPVPYRTDPWPDAEED